MDKASDPACLFYWGDWAGGTARFSRHLKGCYMDLLFAQFNGGPLSLDEVKTVLGSDFGQHWPTLQKKFKTTPDGHFFNARLQKEQDKRSSYVRSRQKNLEPHMDVHMENGNESRIGNETGKEGAGRKPMPSKLTPVPCDAETDEMHLLWEKWGTLIVDDLDHGWHDMKGRKISRQEMDAFISVATRCEWGMGSQMKFRISLRGFDWKKYGYGSDTKTGSGTGALKGAAPTGGYGKPLG